MQQPPDPKREFVRQWLHKAEQDLATAKLLATERIDLGFSIGFHCQQAVEKLAKAVLVWHQVEFPKTHDIRLLALLVRSVDPDVARVLHDARNLTTYAVEARYPSDLPEPTAEEIERSIAAAEATMQVVRARLPEVIE